MRSAARQLRWLGCCSSALSLRRLRLLRVLVPGRFHGACGLLQELVEVGLSEEAIAVRRVAVHRNLAVFRLGSERVLRHAEHLRRFGNTHVHIQLGHVVTPDLDGRAISSPINLPKSATS